MMAALPFLFLGGLVFVEQDIPGIRVEEVRPLSGAVLTNFRVADLDHDGARDLLLPNEVWFQRDRRFTPDARAPMPGRDQRAFCDTWKGVIYLRFAGKFQIIQWENGQWSTVLDQEVSWPMPGAQADTEFPPESTGVRFERFLYDLDGDGTPEVIAAAEDGLYVYRRNGNGYGEAARLDVLPPLSLAHPARRQLWPPEAREIVTPGRDMSCRFFVGGSRVAVITREDCPDARVRYRTKRYALDPKNGFAVMPAETREEVTGPLPNYLQPCRLNADDVIDYAGGEWELSESTAMPVPVYETCASTDGGKTIQSVKTPSYTPSCSFIDFDGDGRLDMVTEATGLFEHGVRETLDLLLTSREVAHEIHVHFQNAEGIFSRSPDVRARFTIQLDAPPAQDSDRFKRYQSMELFDITGDFNGDGRRDLVVEDRPNRLAVYLNRNKTFPKQPDAIIPIENDASFGLADVDGDGRTDLVVRRQDASSDALAMRSRVYLSREDAP